MSTIETKLAQIGNRSETTTGTVNPPVYFSTAYRHEGIGKSTGFDYSRTGNPTRGLLEQAIADLEYGEQGYACSSGMALFSSSFLYSARDELIVSEDLYGERIDYFLSMKKWNVRCRYVNTQSIKQIEQAITTETKAIFIETPTNPLMQVTDIAAVATVAKRNGLLLIVDNTFYTPYIQQPLTEGADIVLHSATKYLGDITMY